MNQLCRSTSNEWQEDATASLDLDDEGARLQPFVGVGLNDNAIETGLDEAVYVPH